MITVKSGWDPSRQISLPEMPASADNDEPALQEVLLRVAADNGGKLYAIIDAARNEAVLQKLALEESRFDSLFKGSKVEEQYFAVSPFLVECNEKTEPLNWLTSNVWGTSVGVFFTSSDGFVNHFTHFRRFLEVVTEEEKKLYFRFFDPRVLRVYLPTCTAEELTLLFGTATSFLVESEEGGNILCYRPTDPGAGQATASAGPTNSLGKLIIRSAQMAAFREDSTRQFEDKMVAHLHRGYNSECETLGEEEVREVIRLGIKRAGQYGIKSEKGAGEYVFLMFDFGRYFDKDKAYPWAAQILNDPGISDPAARISRLRNTADGHKSEAGGILADGAS